VTAAEIKEVQPGLVTEFKKIEFVATNQVKVSNFGNERRSQAKYIGSVGPAGKQRHSKFIL
jgi:hypothetical protein